MSVFTPCFHSCSYYQPANTPKQAKCIPKLIKTTIFLPFKQLPGNGTKKYQAAKLKL
jgi:hypothetical protein